MQMARERFEILESLHDMDGDKAPGPNGFTVAFFKFCWDRTYQKKVLLGHNGGECDAGIPRVLHPLCPKCWNLMLVFQEFWTLEICKAICYLLARYAKSNS